MRLICCSLLVLALCSSRAAAGPFTICTKQQLVRLNMKLHGSVVDFTNNHRVDRRFWSEALSAKREMYVYLPPCYDEKKQYPIMVWLHGFIQDEKNFLDIVPYFDQAIASGMMPPMIIAAPDGSIVGNPGIFFAGSFYVNSHAGRYEDYLANDVWNFLVANFSIRPEPEAHILAGASMGGFGAYNHGIKYRERYKVIVGIMPAVNLRYVNCKGRYMANFDPDCFALQERYRPHGTIAVFYGVVRIQQKHLFDRLYGSDAKHAHEHIARENPFEMLETYDVKPGELELFIGYGGRDEFNIDAQVESFLYFASKRGIDVHAIKDPKGRHDTATGLRMLPDLSAWLSERVKKYSPPTGNEVTPR